MIDELLLISGNDIPFPDAQLIIHQPQLKEIAFLGEAPFYTGCELINFSKLLLGEEDKINLENKSNFDIIMSIVNDNSSLAKEKKENFLMLLELILPQYKIKLLKDQIICFNDQQAHSINNMNFEEFKQIIVRMFCLDKQKSDEAVYNPGGPRAAELAAKFYKARQIISQDRAQDIKISVLSRYVSILAVGLQKDVNSLLNYTVYQIYDEFERFTLKQAFDIHLQAQMAGAKNLKEVDEWMKDIHP